MSKKGKRKSKQSKPEEKSPKKKNLTVVILVLVIASLVAVGVGLKLSSKESPDKTVSAAVAADSSLRRGETRPTLSPSQFSHPDVAGAYQIAKDIPHVLDALYCYCFCNEKPFYHKSVLSCFVDMHAAG